MEIKASQVKELRELSGVGMMECKKALVEVEGDIEKALDLLRSNSALKAEKKSARVAADGVIKVYVSEDYATMVEINSETDFAAKDDSFIEFTKNIEERLVEKKYLDVEDLKKDVEEDRQKLVQSIGENIQIRRLATQEFDSSKKVGTYLHSDNKLAAMVLLKEENVELGRDIAMHISASAPLSINEDGVDKNVLERERNIFESQARESGKDENIMQKMVEGKIKKFLKEVTLLSQDFIKDPDTSISKLLENSDNEVVSFERFKVGEGIEVSSKDFAEEVAEQLNKDG
ncbi:MAG: translation elongation factor Ts [Gammaproteobacteria bacterium]